MEKLQNCPRCSSSGHREGLVVRDHSISQEEFTLTDCIQCGLRFTNPRPSTDTIGAYYRSDDYISHSNSSKSLQDKLYQLARRLALRKKYRMIHALQTHGKVLDVGCGTGEFLSYLMSRGYLVEGVEPDLQARERAIASYAIPVLPSLELVPAQEQFQVITLWHVLEHVPNLRATFKRLFASLADQGVLLIAVPDRESWDAQHYGPKWAAWDVPRHLTHFRRADVHAFLNEHGFELIATKRMWMDAPYIAMLSESYNGASKSAALIKGALMGTWSNLVSLVTGCPTSSTLYIARKQEP